MPPSNSGPKASSAPSGAGKAEPKWKMPRPGALVVWRNAPGAAPVHAVVTQIGRNAINVMIFPPDSKVGIPKDSVRHVDDPWNKQYGINADAGCWEHTDEYKRLQAIEALAFAPNHLPS